jgi:predicted phage baseplate assembly protein
VIFGDGEQGARPPSGTENIVAHYRCGIGSSGLVRAGSLTLLQTRPLGVRSVTNPVAASGAADPERLEGARVNAPNTVLTLDRIVSIDDYEAFARAFAGIGKAQAVPIWLGETHLVHLTLAGVNGARVETTSTTYKDLLEAIGANSDPVQPFRVDPHQPLYFKLTARIIVDPHYDSAQVVTAVRAALTDAFSFDKREFGQAVTAAAVISTIQQAAGVVATDLNQLYRSDDDQGPQQTEPAQLLIAERAKLVHGGIQPGQLLLLSPLGASLSAVAALQ